MLAYHQVSQAKARYHFQPCTSRVEATHHHAELACLSSAVLQGQSAPIDPSIGSVDASAAGADVWMLDTDAEDLPGLLEAYVCKMEQTFFDQEPSAFMRSTLALALELSVQKKVSQKREEQETGLMVRCGGTGCAPHSHAGTVVGQPYPGGLGGGMAD